MDDGSQIGVAFAKTTRPAMATAVPREALFAHLDGTPGRKVGWICGPPGAGKTTLAAGYVQARGLQCLWYQVDSDDADPATFFHYLRHAARKIAGERSDEIPTFTPQHAGDVAAFARRFFRQFFAQLSAPTALVLDNLHSIAPDSPVYAALEAGFAQVPAKSCVIVTSRSDPPVEFARMRASGEMCCLSGENLRLSENELKEIARLRGQALSPEVVSKLHERTQGWAAGLVLMLEHAKLSGRIADLPGNAAPKVVFDYLAGEIFERFDHKTRDFLMRIACLPRLTAHVAEALSGEPRAARLLLNLALNDYFVREISGEEGRLFQLHPLLSEFLRNRAAQALPEALGAENLERAAALMRNAGQIEDAVSLLAECKDWLAIAAIVREHSPLMLAQGRTGTLGAWLDLLPREMVDADPRLLRAAAAARLHVSPRIARQFYERAFEGFRLANDEPGMLQSCRGAIDATLFEFDDFTALDRWSELLAAQLQGGWKRSSDEAAPAVASLITALLLRGGASGELDVWLGLADGTSIPGDPSHRLPLARGLAATLLGDFAAAESILGGVRSAIGAPETGVRLACESVSALGQLLAGACSNALAVARDALATADAEGVHTFDNWLRVVAAAAALGTGSRDTAREEVTGLAAPGARLSRGMRALMHWLRAWLAAQDGDAAAAAREAKTAVETAVETGIPWLECLARLAAAHALAAADARAADAQLRAAESLSSGLRCPALEFAVRIAAADIAAASDDKTGVRTALRDAFATGRMHDLRHALCWRAQAVADLCAIALQEGIEPDFARSLVRANRLIPRVPPLRIRQWPWSFRVETLGHFVLLKDDAEVEFSSKGPGRPMELLKVLVALGGRNVRADQLADALWPQMDADYAHKSFTATLHRLRRLLDEDEAVILRDGRLSLNRAAFWVDTWALDGLFDAFEATARDAANAGSEDAARAFAEEVLSLYRGPFLSDEFEQPSYIAFREQLRARLARSLTRVVRLWEEAGRSDLATDCLQRAIEADNLYEPLYRHLMLCYQRQGNAQEAVATYERLRALLAARLKIMPSPETQAILATLNAQAPARKS